jgi:diguanylate cyclase (GGDEF)-like protein
MGQDAPAIHRLRPPLIDSMLPKLLTPFWLTTAATIGSVAVSLLVTWGVLTALNGSPPLIAYLLAGFIPAIFAPMIVLPLALVLARLKRVGSELASLAHTDALTGLPNRRAFFERSEAILSEVKNGPPVAAMMIDVDRFKAINDEFGHAGGDALLTAIGNAIADAVAASGAPRSVAARLGGEEFAVLVSGLVPTAVARLADRICAAGRQTKVTMAGVEIASTVSIGVATRTGSSGIDPLLKLADDAVYIAKRGGRDRWAFASGHGTAPEARDAHPRAVRLAMRAQPGAPPGEPNPPMIAS